MKRIPVKLTELKAAIQRHRPGWTRWGDIKPVFLDLQRYHCGFCERNIGGRPDPRTGRRDLYEQDVEHFRPKAEVVRWDPPPEWTDPPPILQGPARGYPWLEKDERNYVCSCKTCNSARKKNFFPIASPLPDYSLEPDPEALRAEQPYLIFPFGYLEAKAPEEYLAFLGPEPWPHPDLPTGSHDYWRAMVTIAILGLDRADDNYRRCELVAQIGREWCLVTPGQRASLYTRYCRPEAEFTSCSGHFLKLCEDNPNVAKVLAVKAATEVGWPQVEIDVLNRRWPA